MSEAIAVKPADKTFEAGLVFCRGELCIPTYSYGYGNWTHDYVSSFQLLRVHKDYPFCVKNHILLVNMLNLRLLKIQDLLKT